MKSYNELRTSATNSSIVEEVKAAINRYEQESFNALITTNFEDALVQAEESDKRIASGNARALEGMIIGVKDNISTKGIRTTAASKILENFTPIYDATVVQRLKDAGGIIIGKANLDEFAMGSSNETSYFGPVKNPYDVERVPGGSSGGSAAAVAAKFCHTSLGSDTGGSVRQPAAFTNTYGFKPTYGRISRYGLLAFASSVDHIGTFSNTLEDAALLYDVISGNDPMDATSSSEKNPSLVEALKSTPNKIVIGELPDTILKDCDNEIMKRYQEYKQRFLEFGATFKTVSIPHDEVWIPTYYILTSAEASSNLSRYDGVRFGIRSEHTDEVIDYVTATRTEGFGKEVKRRIMLGTYVLSSGYYDAYYKKAQQARRIILNSYKEIFSSVDAVFLPTTATPPFKIGEKTSDPISMYLSDYFTASSPLAGIPSISFPAGMTKTGLPIGLQLQTTHFREDLLFQLCAMIR
jgi:aspartyl-tRNA(Asn)/glutamyl-tRNA(Gln) amidotransferase subunit A